MVCDRRQHETGEQRAINVRCGTYMIPQLVERVALQTSHESPRPPRPGRGLATIARR